MLSSSALIGMTTEPVMRKSSANVPSTTSPTAYGALADIEARKSIWPAACPVVRVSKGALVARIVVTSSCASSEVGGPATRMSTRWSVVPSGVTARDSTPGSSRNCCGPRASRPRCRTSAPRP